MARRSKSSRRAKNKYTQTAKALASLIAGLVIVFGGSAAGIWMVADAHNERRVLSEGVRTIGVVTNVDFSTSGRNQKEYTNLTVTFLAADRSVYARGVSAPYYEHRDGSKETVEAEWHGQRLVVFYDRSDPSQSVVEGEAQSFALGYVLIIFCVFFGASFIWTGRPGFR